MKFDNLVGELVSLANIATLFFTNAVKDGTPTSGLKRQKE